MLPRSLSRRDLAVPLLLVVGCGGSAEPAKSTEAPAPRTAPTFELVAPGEQLSPELNQLLSQLQLNNPNLANVSAQIASHKHAAAKLRAGRKLIDLVQRVAAPNWLQSHREDVVEANAKAGRVATEPQLRAQLENRQTEALAPIYQAMQNLGGEIVIEHSLSIVRNVALLPERRALALGVLSMQLPPGDSRSDEVGRYTAEIDKKLAAVRSNPAALREAQLTIHDLAGPLEKCYLAELGKTPDLKVSGKLALSVGRDGSVTSAKGKDLAPPSLNACVERAGNAAKFSARAEPTTMTVPIMFKPD